MEDRSLAALIANRAARAGVPVDDSLAASLAAYVDLLSRWNRRINLTALALSPPTDEGVDRLIVEPLIAARLIRSDERRILDVGSGGGSPAIPMRLALPSVQFVLVEVKTRKAAFLRAVVRELALANVEVENHALAELISAGAARPAADVVTMRAVRPDRGLTTHIRRSLRPDGRLFWFGSAASASGLAGWQPEAAVPLPAGGVLSIVSARAQ